MARPGPGEDRQVEAERERLGAGRVVRIGVGQGDRHEAAAVGGDRAEDRVRGGVRRIARVDHDDLALPDEVGVRGLAGHGARGADDDPGQPRPLPDDARRGRGTGRDPGDDLVEPVPRARAAGASRRSAPTSRPRPRPSPRARRAAVSQRWSTTSLGLERRLGAGRQLRGEEPRVEAAGHDRRRRPVRDRGEPVGAEHAGRAPRRPRRGSSRPASSARRAPATAAASGARPSRRSASSTPASSKSSRIAAIANGGSPASPEALAVIARSTSRSSASAASTRPPGNTNRSPANAIDDGRWVSRISGAPRPGRSRTTVAAGVGGAASSAMAAIVGRAHDDRPVRRGAEPGDYPL